MTAPCDFDTEVVAAYGAVVTGDADGAAVHLDAAEAQLACADDPASLARFWLVEAATLTAHGDPDAELSLVAARRVAPTVWLPALPSALEVRWAVSRPEVGAGSIALDVPLGSRVASVDAAPWSGGPVSAGLHALRITGPTGEPLFGAIVYVGAGTEASVATGLPTAAAPIAPPAPTPAPRSARTVALPLSLGIGASLALGRPEFVAIDGIAFSEPAQKWVVPIELSQGIGYGAGWARLELGAGWLFAGPYLGVRSDGTLHHTSVRLDLAASGGARADLGSLGRSLGGSLGGWVGGSFGVQWPGRLVARAVAGAGLGAHGWVEARLGGNLGTAARLEPAAEVLVGGVVDWGRGR